MSQKVTVLIVLLSIAQLSLQQNWNAPVFGQPAAAAAPSASGPYPIQQPTITNTGETIMENLLAGLPFNCVGLATGHHRDSKYCNIFHACVYGQQRKTYLCPFVGEHTYFDEVTRRCEFVRNNPSVCATSIFY